MRRFNSLALIAFFLCSLFVSVEGHAQSPTPLANPNLQLATNGVVNAVVCLPDGSVVFGGNFSSVNGLPRSNIAKQLSNGTLDPTWNPGADGWIYALAADAGGNVYAGGIFGNIGGQTRRAIAKLSGTGIGSADPAWNASADYDVHAIATDASGDVYVGGAFNIIGGRFRQSVAKLSGTDGTADATWDPSTNGAGSVTAIALDGSSDVYVGGTFLSIGGQVRNYLAKLSGSGTGSADANWNPAPDQYVSALAVDVSGNVYVGGSFSSVGGQTRSHIAKLSSLNTGAADATWNPAADGNVLALAIDISGNIYAAGTFNNIGTKSRRHVAKLSNTDFGTADATWDPSTDGFISALASNSSGNVYLGGTFSRVGEQIRLSFASVSNSGVGVVGIATDAENPGSVSAIAVQPSGGVIVGGAFFKANGVSRTHILRLNSDGKLDPTWNPSANNPVYALSTDASSNVYVGGSFSSIGGQPRMYIAKLSGSGTGSADAAWNPAADNSVLTLIAATSGDIYVGGDFGHIGGQMRAYICKLSSAGDADASWDPSADNYVSALATDTSGDVYVGGSFHNIGGQVRNGIAKLQGTGIGVADSMWNPSPDNALVSALALDASGNVYVGGYFNHIGGEQRFGIGRVSGTGTGVADSAWDPAIQPGSSVYSFAIDSFGAVYVAGSFQKIGGQSRNNIAKLSGGNTAIADAAWNPSADSSVTTIAINNGEMYAGGFFSSIGGQNRTRLASLALDGVFANGFEN